MTILKPIHLSKLGLSKLTLQRWLEAQESLPGGKRLWKVQRELINRRTKTYYPHEIEALLSLGQCAYPGFKGINREAKNRLGRHVTQQRSAKVRAALNKLSKLTK